MKKFYIYPQVELFNYEPVEKYEELLTVPRPSKLVFRSVTDWKQCNVMIEYLQKNPAITGKTLLEFNYKILQSIPTKW